MHLFTYGPSTSKDDSFSSTRAAADRFMELIKRSHENCWITFDSCTRTLSVSIEGRNDPTYGLVADNDKETNLLEALFSSCKALLEYGWEGTKDVFVPKTVVMNGERLRDVIRTTFEFVPLSTRGSRPPMESIADTEAPTVREPPRFTAVNPFGSERDILDVCQDLNDMHAESELADLEQGWSQAPGSQLPRTNEIDDGWDIPAVNAA